MSKNYPSWVGKMDDHYRKREPFFSVISFDRQVGHVFEAKTCADQGILFNMNGAANFTRTSADLKKPDVTFEPYSLSVYSEQFQEVLKEIKHGNTYLLNLCAASALDGKVDLLSLFYQSQADYRLFFKNEFIVFSPESFIKLKDETIRSFPMKGTIDANLPNAAELLLSDEKERAEHYTIVDLIRNDVGSVCDDVQVPRFAYLDKIDTSKGPVLQMSSEVTGTISKDYVNSPGKLFYKLLPAGSISGAPKAKTLEIIQNVEKMKRGYYTGIMIYFDGRSIDSGVMIRFIEKDKNGRCWYKSGGGITHKSQMITEYNELIRKVYLPFS